MGEIRLYYKIVSISKELTRFYYYNGYYNNSKKKLESYNKTIKNTDLNEIIDMFDTDNNFLLYYMNKIEYSKLMKQINKYETFSDDIVENTEGKVNSIKNKLFEIIRLKNEFNAWFKYSGFEELN